MANEEQLQALQTELKKSLRILSLPVSVLDMLEKIPESEVEKRPQFIKDNFEDHLEKLKEAEYCIIPSILGPNNFNLAIKVGGKIKKFTGAIKTDHFEIHPRYDTLIKSKTLNECIERVLLQFEKQAVIPILYEAHRGAVEDNARKTLEEAIENRNLAKIISLFNYLHLKEIEEDILFKAFSSSSKEVIDYFVKKILNHELLFRQFESRKHSSKEKFEQILGYARKRSAKADPENTEISEMIRDYLMKQDSQRFTKNVLEQEKRMDEFFKAMAELSDLNCRDQRFLEKRSVLEQKMLKLLEQLGSNASMALNIKIGSQNVYALDIALTKGSVNFVRNILKNGATPTVGWKYESLENFENNKRSALRYILEKSIHPVAEKDQIATILGEFLKEYELKMAQQAAAKQLAQGTLELLKNMVDGKENSTTHSQRKDRP